MRYQIEPLSVRPTLRAAGCLLALMGGAAMAEEPGPAHGGAVPPANVAGKKLVRWAAEITQKTTVFDLPDRLPSWQEAGLDGLCFNLRSHANGSAREVLLAAENGMFFRWWMARKRTREEFAPDIRAFKSIKDWGRLTDNFILTASVANDGVAPDYLFNENTWAAILSNFSLVARIAKEIGFKGIVFDVEQYGWAAKGAWRQPWNYAAYASGGFRACGHAEPLPFVEVASRVRVRGQQWIEAMLSEFPDVVVAVAPGLYEAPWRRCRSFDKGLAEVDCGLWAPFVDGVLLGLTDEASLVAFSENTYAMSQYADMVAVRDRAMRQALVVSTVPELAQRHITFAAGLWTDAAYGRTGSFSNTDPAANHRDPLRHEHAVSNALAVSDRYAWLYGEASYFLRWGEGYPFVPGFDKTYDRPPALIRRYWKATADGHAPHDLDWRPTPVVDDADYAAFNAQAAARNRKFWEARQEAGYDTVLTLPERWRFMLDPEMLGRLRDYGRFDSWKDSSWLSVSAKTCWQSQGYRTNTYAFYGLQFQAPAELDLQSRDVFLAFGAYGSGAANIYFNGAWIDYLPHNAIPKITDKLQPGQRNTVVLGFLNKQGPGGLAGDVKLLARPKAP